MNLRRLKVADVLAGLFGAALVGLLWAPWYRVPERVVHFDRSVGAPEVTAFFGPRIDVTAWQAMSVNDLIFFIAGLMAIWLLVATVSYSTPAVPLATAVFTTGLGLLASVLAVIRLIWPPDIFLGPTFRAPGAWLGAAAAIGMAISAALGMHSEGRTVPDPSAIPITPAPPVSP